MDSLPKLNTSPEAPSDSARNSYTSATDSQPYSARSSYVSTSDAIPSSIRTSYSSLTESFARVSSFSRTSTVFEPDSEANTPLSPGELSPISSKGWKDNEEVIGVERPSARGNSEIKPPSHIRTASKDGPSALKDLENVRNVICVAFGAFDRYYLSWEDNNGEFHQEGHKLPECLNRWLFLPEGQTRHLPTLQVSLGSNDEFFASDKDGKLSSRDPTCQPGENKPIPRLAEITRAMIRQKAHTVSGSSLPEDLLARVDAKPESPKLERRKTFQLGQDIPRPERKSTITPLIEPSQLIRLEPKPKPISIDEAPSVMSDDKPGVPKIDHSRRKSLLTGAPPVRPSWPKVQILSAAREGLRSQRMQEDASARDRIQSQEKQADPPAKTTKYVDAGVQTEIEPEPFLPLQTQSIPLETQTSYSYLPPQHMISIGSMQDFCRGQYRLGDALRTYV